MDSGGMEVKTKAFTSQSDWVINHKINGVAEHWYNCGWTCAHWRSAEVLLKDLDVFRESSCSKGDGTIISIVLSGLNEACQAQVHPEG